MEFKINKYYHLYNRTNNEEGLFRSHENYIYFLKKYRFYLDEYLETIGYCLMPTHFHFLVRVRSITDGVHLRGGLHLNELNKSKNTEYEAQSGLHLNELNKSKNTEKEAQSGLHLVEVNVSLLISDRLGILLSSYTKAINKLYNRHGSLFQRHSKAKEIESEEYLINILTYIHQNPLRSNLVENVCDWNYSSFRDYIDLRTGNLPSKSVILTKLKIGELREFTEKKLLKSPF